MSTHDDMQELIKQIVQSMVDEPDAVALESIERNGDTLLQLRVAPSDVGKVIGKQGRTVRSLRTILTSASIRQQKRYSLDILEETSSTPVVQQ